MVAIAPAVVLSVGTRLQARRVELATQAARTYVDGVRSGSIATPNFIKVLNEVNLTNPSAPKFDPKRDIFSQVTSPAAISLASCTIPTSTTGGTSSPQGYYCYNKLPTDMSDRETYQSLYCVNLDGGGCASNSRSSKNMIVQAFRIASSATDTGSGGYVMGVRVYRLDVFDGSNTVLKKTQETSRRTATYTAGVGDRTSPLVELTTEIAPATQTDPSGRWEVVLRRLQQRVLVRNRQARVNSILLTQVFVSPRVKHIMVKLLQLLLTYKLRTTQPAQKNGGFTLIEILVGLVLAFLVITPLLGFMVNLLQTDRQEQAKANSEQEIQAAADYISRDVEQAIYIYDGYGLSKIKAQLPQPDTNSVPVLVFWKRQIIPDIIPTAKGKNDDAFVYSLVAYYLTKSAGTTACVQDTWSCTARITRIQLKNEVKVGTNIIQNKDPGFVLFDPTLNSSSTEDSMNAWPGTATPSYDLSKTPAQVLIDYIDPTPFDPNTQGCPPITPTRTNLPADYVVNTASQVPVTPALAGFSACVDVGHTSAQIFIRGNALARTRLKTPNPPQYSSDKSVATYFPTVRIQVQGRGVFKVNQKS
jgi:type II secretory pathway pseudopilin PulG